MGMKAKRVSEKLEEYKRLKKLAEDIENVLSQIEKAEKKKKDEQVSIYTTTGSFVWPVDNATTWSSDITISGKPVYTTISINSDIISLIKDDIKDLLEKKLVEVKNKMDKLEI